MIAADRREVVFELVRAINSDGGIGDRVVLIRSRRESFELQCSGQIVVIGGTPELGAALDGPALRVATVEALISLRIKVASRRAETAMTPVVGGGLAKHAAANALGGYGILIALGEPPPTPAQLRAALADSVRSGARAMRGLEGMAALAEFAAIAAVDALRGWRWA